MKAVGLLIIIFLSATLGSAQPYAWVTFTDKGPSVSERLSQPQAFLSQASIDRRLKRQIPITAQDLPLYLPYLQELRPHVSRVVVRSRWFNSALVSLGPSSLEEIRQLPFVVSTTLIRDHPGRISQAEDLAQDPSEDLLLYGMASFQAEMMGLPAFHAKGFRGKGLRIAILDAGFPGVDSLVAFDSLRSRGGVIATYDFVSDTSWVYHSSAHGTRVLSTIGAYLQDQMIGTAPEADVMLFRTEDARQELQIEEFYWLAGAEMADSIGADVLHSSLGYNVFQDSPGYTYEDLDGNKAIVTKAADWAAARGIFVVTSAGNEGRNRWKYITAPCDGDSVLCVGSVTRWRDLSGFSSIGPTADGRIKPDVVAMGTGTTTLGPSPKLQLSNGTSFAAPMVAGLGACLMQAHPERSNMEIIQAIRLSADQAGLPDNEYGYGIPDALQADSLLASEQDLFSLTIVQRQKPPRGKNAVTETPPAVEVSGNLPWRWDGFHIVILLPSETLQVSQVKVSLGEQTVIPNPNDMERRGKEIWIQTERWIQGEYDILVEALSLREKITVQVPRS